MTDGGRDMASVRPTEFPTPIIIEFDGQVRQRFNAIVDGAAARTADRATTRLNVHTTAEAQALLATFEAMDLLAFEPIQFRALHRVRDELVAGLTERGYDVADGECREQELLADSGETCPQCGEPITHTVSDGPGKTRNACGCAVEPDLVTDGGRDVRTVHVGQVEVDVYPDDTVTDLFDRTDGPLEVTPENTVLCRPFSNSDLPPAVADYISFDLEEVDDGDALELYRLPASERPAYEKAVQTDGGTAFPPDHPLTHYADALEDHASHLDVFGEVLQNADPEDVQAAMVVLTGENGTDTLPTVSESVDPRWASLWMLGAHIQHVASAASAASGDQQSMEHIAQDAIRAIREHEGDQEVYE